MVDRVELQPGQILLRHIKLGLSTDPGAVQVIGSWLTPQPLNGVNGPQGFVSGVYERRRDEEGTFSLIFPNTVGGDGVKHVDRFLILSALAYRPGDEWIEVWRTTTGGLPGDLLFVGTPDAWDNDRGNIKISGYDALWMLKKQRETAAGFWTGQGPADVFDLYTQAWTVAQASGFDSEAFTYSTSEQTLAGWRYQQADVTTPSEVRVRSGTAANSYVGGTVTVPVGGTSADGSQVAWRAEAVFRRGGTSAVLNAFLIVASAFTAGVPLNATPQIRIEDYKDGRFGLHQLGTNSAFTTLAPVPAYDALSSISLVLEGRDRWVFAYRNGQLMGVIPSLNGKFDAVVLFVGQANVADVPIYLQSLSFQRTQPFLMRSAAAADLPDLRLPGNLPGGGLVGTYLDDTSQSSGGEDPDASVGSAFYSRYLMRPTKTPTARRLDKTINFASANPPAWQPGGVPANYFSARYAGAVHLDLVNYDYAFRITGDDWYRLWVGKTRIGAQVIDAFVGAISPTNPTYSPWLKAGNTATSSNSPSGSSGPLNGQGAGWFALLLEYAQAVGPGGLVFEVTRSDGVGTWAAANTVDAIGTEPPGNVVTSPIGGYQAQVRYDSFYEQLRAVRDTYGIQFTCSPRSLESGAFPGQITPRAREGRDTEFVQDSIDGVEIASKGDADDASDTLIVDASGLADSTGAAQLSQQAVNFAELGKHLVVSSDYESLADITIPALLQQRANSLLALRAAAWEEVGVRPRGTRQLADSFPLTGALAEFAWLPGDGIRVRLPELGVDDTALGQGPRAIMGVSWPFTPDGLQRPSAAFRQRLRNFPEELRQTKRVALQSDRNYQGQLVVVTGSWGQVGGAVDNYSRVPLPANLGTVVKATAVVVQVSSGVTYSIEVNGVTQITGLTAVGRYDISPWVAKANSTEPRMYVRGPITGGSGTVEIQVELLVRT